MKQNLLIVDDEPDILDFLERVFRKEYTIHRAERGDRALEILKETNIDILITDQKMPGMTGLDLLAAISKTLPEGDSIVKVLLSGYAEVPEIVKAIQRYGIHQYVVKPIDSKRLRQAVVEAKKRCMSASGDWVLTRGTDPGF